MRPGQEDIASADSQDATPDHEIGEEEADFVELFAARSPVHTAMVRSMLDGTGIVYFIEASQVAGETFFIRKDQIEEAQSLLQDFQPKDVVDDTSFFHREDGDEESPST